MRQCIPSRFMDSFSYCRILPWMNFFICSTMTRLGLLTTLPDRRTHARQVEATPDRRLGIHQVDPHPQTLRSLRPSPDHWRRLIEHPRERIPASVSHQLLKQRQIRTSPEHTALPLPPFSGAPPANQTPEHYSKTSWLIRRSLHHRLRRALFVGTRRVLQSAPGSR